MAGSVKVHSRLEFPYRSKAQAETIARSLRVDDASYITTTVDGRTLVAEAEADSFLSLLLTLDDYLACVSVAEKVLRGG